jgi:hypothetical protein
MVSLDALHAGENKAYAVLGSVEQEIGRFLSKWQGSSQPKRDVPPMEH